MSDAHRAVCDRLAAQLWPDASVRVVASPRSRQGFGMPPQHKGVIRQRPGDAPDVLELAGSWRKLAEQLEGRAGAVDATDERHMHQW